MYGVGVVVAELMDDFGDAVMVAFGKGGSDGGFEAVKVLSQRCFHDANSRRQSLMHKVYEPSMHPKRRKYMFASLCLSPSGDTMQR
jgi:hypothetical protein